WAKRRTSHSKVRGGSFRSSGATASAPKSSQARSSASSRRLTESLPGSFHPRRTTSSGVKRAPTRRCAARIMSGTFELRLPFDEPEEHDEDLRLKADGTYGADAEDRAAATDPAQNIVLEASAGTGKTRVLVERYVNLLRAGVEPDHILAITFTRKAAAEMRQRILERLKEASRLSEFDAVR